MRTISHLTFLPAVFTFSTLLFFCMESTGMADEPALSDEEAENIALATVDGIFFDWQQESVFDRTNGMTVVTLPRYRFAGDNPTNPPNHAAVVWIEDATRLVVPNPGLVPLSDEQAVLIATNAVLVPFDHEKSISVARPASLTVVTLPRPDVAISGFVYTNGFAAKVWIDTETRTIIGIEGEPD